MEYELCKITQKLWRDYLLNPTKESLQNIADNCDSALVLIGTGKHEFYTSSEAAFGPLQREREKGNIISFAIINEWYECRCISPDIYMVYGGLWIREKETEEKHILVEMDSRFSIIYKATENSYTILHLHLSVPNAEQGNDEYYPKAISEKANLLVTELKQKAEKDMMTGLFNHMTFKQYVNNYMKKNLSGAFYMIDIDNFKQINDRYGHEQGDNVIKDFAGILFVSFDSHSYFGRLGGDEFAVFEPKAAKKSSIQQKAQKLINDFHALSDKYGEDLQLSCSIGIAQASTVNNTFSRLYRMADKSLYLSKKTGRGTYHLSEEI